MSNLNSFGEVDVRDCRYRNCMRLRSGFCNYGHSVEEILDEHPHMSDIRQDLKDGIISVINSHKKNASECYSHNLSLQITKNGLFTENQRLSATINTLKADKTALTTKIQDLERKQEILNVRTRDHNNEMKIEKDKNIRLNSELEMERGKYNRNNLKKLDPNKLDELMDECIDHVKRIRNEKNDRNSHYFCIICCSNIKDCLLFPCQHLILCTKCSNKIYRCPVCQSKITKRIKCFR